ncbi:AGAP009420-PA, partial [Anopheles gambiae str. PEST]
EFSSSLFKNLPVRQKKGTVPHLENYCLFDPSVDFFNEKEHKMRAIPEAVELADQVLYQDHLIYDAVVDRDSDNYFTIEPESLEIEVKNRLSLEKVEEKIDEIFNKTRTASSSSTSSTSGSSPDYPSMFNSVIETPSSNLESTDESDYGFRNRLMENLKVLVPKSISGSIPDENAEVQEIPDEEAELVEDATVAPSSSSDYYGVVLKAGSAAAAASRLERVHQQQSVSLPNSPLIQHRLQQQQQQQQQAMKQQRKSISKVQSQAIAPHQPRNGSLDSTPLFNRLRKRERPLSNHSDADSGFLSPATPPDSNGASILAACDEVMDQAAQGT